ncbi:T9SS type A sorting domain-containing protein [Bizionia gelidisalsuginis]|uniref:T9SS type A sorting domain-containing protein n=2 Tax=Bizionia TaxID=283785 RepID=A0A8H2QKI4_9FLAO|nr:MULTISPECIES: T9SS type A sorting domain-containing protein [Bizionia]TYB70663.1 T9SS type A sorting domain-containing protein [Bizionia saleffrena]TYC10209.1 T9SS type A sorting domain-containing protein [Bizionia gelidisalsuginis]
MKKIYALLYFFSLFASSLLAQGTETFSNLGLSGSNYATGSYTGDNGVTWNYIECRDENGDANGAGIDGSAIMLRRSSDNSAISAQSGANGVGEISMKLYKGFTGDGPRSVELFVNGVSRGTSTGFDDTSEHIFTVTAINEPGEVLIALKNATGKQIIVDDFVWTATGVTLSKERFKKADAFSIYPNPTNTGFVTITNKNNSPVIVSVFDVLGKQVISTTVNNKRLNIASLNAGVYVMQLNQSGVLTTKKLVIK